MYAEALQASYKMARLRTHEAGHIVPEYSQVTAQNWRHFIRSLAITTPSHRSGQQVTHTITDYGASKFSVWSISLEQSAHRVRSIR